MVTINTALASQGVRIISISLDDDRRKLPGFIKSKRMNWTHAIDGGPNALARQFGVSSIPSVFILSPQGTVLWNGHPARMDQPLAKALAEHPPAPPAAALRAQAVTKLDEVQKALDGQDYDAAMKLLGEVNESALYEEELSRRVKTIADKLADAQAEEARSAHAEVARKLPAMQTMLHTIASQMKSGQRAAAVGNIPAAFRAYVTAAQRAADTDLGRAAAQAAAELQANPEYESRLRGIKLEEFPAAAFAIGEAHREASRTELARQCFDAAMQTDEESPWHQRAKEAAAAL